MRASGREGDGLRGARRRSDGGRIERHDVIRDTIARSVGVPGERLGRWECLRVQRDDKWTRDEYPPEKDHPQRNSGDREKPMEIFQGDSLWGRRNTRLSLMVRHHDRAEGADDAAASLRRRRERERVEEGGEARHSTNPFRRATIAARAHLS